MNSIGCIWYCIHVLGFPSIYNVLRFESLPSWYRSISFILSNLYASKENKSNVKEK